MKIIINGQEKNFQNIRTLKEVISNSCKNSARVIAEVNGDIIKTDQWDTKTIREGDTIELVNFVGGG